MELPVFQVTTMAAEMTSHSTPGGRRRGSSASSPPRPLLMAIAGIYGVISYSVGQRGQEISIRMAMGAHANTVLRDVVLQGMRLVVAGTVIGLVLSLAGARAVSGILVGVSATNPWSTSRLRFWWWWWPPPRITCRPAGRPGSIRCGR